jgi:hypothetical protein
MVVCDLTFFLFQSVAYPELLLSLLRSLHDLTITFDGDEKLRRVQMTFLLSYKI